MTQLTQSCILGIALIASAGTAVAAPQFLQPTSLVCIDPADMDRYLGLIERGLTGGGGGVMAAVRYATELDRQFKCYSAGFNPVPVQTSKTSNVKGVVEITLSEDYRQRGFPTKLYTADHSIK